MHSLVHSNMSLRAQAGNSRGEIKNQNWWKKPQFSPEEGESWTLRTISDITLSWASLVVSLTALTWSPGCLTSRPHSVLLWLTAEPNPLCSWPNRVWPNRVWPDLVWVSTLNCSFSFCLFPFFSDLGTWFLCPEPPPLPPHQPPTLTICWWVNSFNFLNISVKFVSCFLLVPCSFSSSSIFFFFFFVNSFTREHTFGQEQTFCTPEEEPENNNSTKVSKKVEVKTWATAPHTGDLCIQATCLNF